MPTVDFSLGAIFQQATGVVQAVLILLLFCSVLCWAIILEKAVLLFRLAREAKALEKAPIEAGLTAYPEGGIARLIIAAGREEWADRHSGESNADRRDRIERVMRHDMIDALLRAEVRLPYLATIGSAAPFIGLFGTVWGIMHSFSLIASTNETSLAAVAPGIAEALSTTAAGLMAAIPASIAYNKLASDFGRLGRRFSLAIGRLSRQLSGPVREAAE